MFCDALSSVACCMMQTMARLLRSHFGSRCAAYIMIYIVEGPLFQNFLSRRAGGRGGKLEAEPAVIHQIDASAVPNRQFFTMDALYSSPEARQIWGWIVKDVKQTMEKLYGACDFSEFQTVLDGMNAGEKDVSQRFAYCAFLGGLVHTQISYLEGDTVWFIIVGPFPPGTRPVDRLGLQMNGLICTKAPADVLAAWQSAPRRHEVLHAVGTNQTIQLHNDSRMCATCSKTHDLQSCTSCGMVRYCGPQCQKSHWKAHKPLCKWAKACIDCRWANACIDVVSGSREAPPQAPEGWKWTQACIKACIEAAPQGGHASIVGGPSMHRSMN